MGLLPVRLHARRKMVFVVSNHCACGVYDESAHSFSQDKNREVLCGHASASTNAPKGFFGFLHVSHRKKTYPLSQPENVCFLNIDFSPFLLRELCFYYPSLICFFCFLLGGRRGLGQVDRVTFRYW